MSSNILYPPQLSRPPSSSSSHFIPGPTSSTLHSRANATPYTPPNGYAESPYGAAAASSSSSGTGYTRTAHELEGQNDERLEGLMGKVRMLKDITIGIGDEVRSSNLELGRMNDAFSSTGSFLSGTFTRMTTMAKRQKGMWCWFMLFLVIVGWLFVMVWFARKIGF